MSNWTKATIYVLSPLIYISGAAVLGVLWPWSLVVTFGLSLLIFIIWFTKITLDIEDWDL